MSVDGKEKNPNTYSSNVSTLNNTRIHLMIPKLFLFLNHITVLLVYIISNNTEALLLIIH